MHCVRSSTYQPRPTYRYSQAVRELLPNCFQSAMETGIQGKENGRDKRGKRCTSLSLFMCDPCNLQLLSRPSAHHWSTTIRRTTHMLVHLFLHMLPHVRGQILTHIRARATVPHLTPHVRPHAWLQGHLWTSGIARHRHHIVRHQRRGAVRYSRAHRRRRVEA